MFCHHLQKQKLLVCVLLSGAAVLLLCLQGQILTAPASGRTPQPLAAAFETRNRHLIVAWTTFFGHEDWLPDIGSLGCGEARCDLSYERARAREASALLLHWRDFDPRHPPPCARRPITVLLNLESPFNSPHDVPPCVHWAATYRHDSDIFAPYGDFVPRNASLPKTQTTPSESGASSNRSGVCALVSNCHSNSGRLAYIRQLASHVPVRVYGSCSEEGLSCPFEEVRDCYRWLGGQCAFFLSFENSLCRDYVTEKLFYALMEGMVPVVMGSDHYAQHLPNRSFIAVSDFASAADLATHLRRVQADPDLYAEYRSWTRDWEARDAAFRWLCQLCDLLHSTRGQVPVRTDLSEWWFGESVCTPVH